MVVYLLVYLVPAVAILVPFQLLKLRAQAKSAQIPAGFLELAAYSFISVLIALAVGVGVGYAVMFGPSHITGDFIGLPWFTMLPALAGGLWVTGKTNKMVGTYLLHRSH